MNRTRNFKYYLAAVISLITFLVYLRALQNGFVILDDNAYVYENPHIRSLNLTFLRWAFFDFYASNWHPLTWISHALDYAVWGLNPPGHHLTNIILHAINTFAVVFLAARLIEIVQKRIPESISPRGERKILVAAGITGALFGLHPLHVESVSWVAERKDLLCAMFFLLSILAYLRYADRGGPLRAPKGAQPQGDVPAQNDPGQAGMTNHGLQFLSRYYLFSLGFFILALMSKPMAVTLPVILLLLDWYPFKRIYSLKTFRSALFEKLPFFGLSLVSSILTMRAQSAGGAIVPMTVAPLSTRVFIAAQSLIDYVWKMAFPFNLVPFYPYPENVSPLSPKYFLAMTLTIGVTLICIVAAKKHRLWLSAWGYYVITLAPVLGIVQVGGQAMADRYTYLPSLGPFFIAGLGGAWLFDRMPAFGKRWMANTVIVAISIVIALPACLTFRQIGVWKNSLVVLNYILEKEPQNSPHVYLYRGAAFEEAGEFERALEDYNRAIALNPSYADAYNNRGLLYEKRGQANKAIEDFQKSIALKPSSREPYFDLGVVFAESGLFDRAIEAFNRAIAIDPAYADAYTNRGIAYAVLGRQSKALADFNKAIELNQRLPGAYFNRGKLHMATGRKRLAIEDFQQACFLGDEGGCRALNDLKREVAGQGK
jgi:Flp pilus assembly protein TadD